MDNDGDGLVDEALGAFCGSTSTRCAGDDDYDSDGDGYTASEYGVTTFRMEVDGGDAEMTNDSDGAKPRRADLGHHLRRWGGVDDCAGDDDYDHGDGYTRRRWLPAESTTYPGAT